MKFKLYRTECRSHFSAGRDSEKVAVWMDKSRMRNVTKSRGEKRNSGFPGCQELYWGKQLRQRKMIFVIVRGQGAENLVANCGI